MILLLVFDLFAKYILLLYFMLLAANYASFWVFHYLVNHVHMAKGPELKKKFFPFSVMMNICYLLAIIAAFAPHIGVICKPEN